VHGSPCRSRPRAIALALHDCPFVSSTHFIHPFHFYHTSSHNYTVFQLGERRYIGRSSSVTFTPSRNTLLPVGAPIDDQRLPAQTITLVTDQAAQCMRECLFSLETRYSFLTPRAYAHRAFIHPGSCHHFLVRDALFAVISIYAAVSTPSLYHMYRRYQAVSSHASGRVGFA